MDRSDFLKTLGLSAGGLFIPETKGFIQNKSIKIYDNYIRGIEHYKYIKVSHKIKEGDELILIRDPKNRYDAFAIQIFWGEHKLGYIAAYENIVLANMLDAGVELKAYVSKKVPGQYYYNGIAIEVFADLIIPGVQLIDSLLAERRADDAIDEYRGHL